MSQEVSLKAPKIDAEDTVSVSTGLCCISSWDPTIASFRLHHICTSFYAKKLHDGMIVIVTYVGFCNHFFY